jgi:hypothetical protein
MSIVFFIYVLREDTPRKSVNKEKIWRSLFLMDPMIMQHAIWRQKVKM